jgi:hypothetical protein
LSAAFGGGIAAVKDRHVGKGYRFGTLKKPFAEYYDMVYLIGPVSKEVKWRSTARCKVFAPSG